MSRAEGAPPGYQISAAEKERKRVLRIRLLLLGMLFAPPVACFVGGHLYNQLARDDEGGVDISPLGTELAGGDIIDERLLVGSLVEAIEQKEPAEPDPTIVKSLLFHALKFYGMLDEVKIKQRINNIFLADSNISRCEGVACVYNTRKGLAVELTNSLFSPAESQTLEWIALIVNLAHEAYHLNVAKVLNIPEIEDYGFAGSYTSFGERRGFQRSEQYNGKTNLIHRSFQNPQTGQFSTIIIPEEFFAEVSKTRYFKHLLNLGLKAALPENLREESWIAFPSMAQGVANALDTKGIEGNPSWQEFWQGRMKPDRVNKFHYESDRLGFFKDIATVIMGRNRNKTTLSQEDKAGLGALALADFVHYGISEYQILTSLISYPLTSDFLEEQAIELSTRIKQLVTQTVTPSRCISLTPTDFSLLFSLLQNQVLNFF